jgi:hypothetical protein
VRGERADAGWLRNRVASDSGCFRDHHVRAVTVVAGRWIGGSESCSIGWCHGGLGADAQGDTPLDRVWGCRERDHGGLSVDVCRGIMDRKVADRNQRKPATRPRLVAKAAAQARKERNAHGKRACMAGAETEAHDGGAPGGRDASVGARELRVSCVVKRRSSRRVVKAASGSGSRHSHRFGRTSVEQ